MAGSKQKAVVNIPGYPGYVVKGKKIIHEESGFVAGVKSGDKWCNTDDDGFEMLSNTPQGLLAQNKAATKAFDEGNGF